MPISAELRREVIERAGNCCEYCRISEDERLLKFHVDHIVALKHNGKDESSNLAYACHKCNAFKGSNIAAADPQTGQATFLYNPRQDSWDDHFRILSTGIIEGLTPQGRVTIFMLRMNDSYRVQQRHALIQLDRYPCKAEAS